jgi:hypothetical protein
MLRAPPSLSQFVRFRSYKIVSFFGTGETTVKLSGENAVGESVGAVVFHEALYSYQITKVIVEIWTIEDTFTIRRE